LTHIVLDARDPQVLAEFWTALLGWSINEEEQDFLAVRAPDSDGCDLDLAFLPVPEPKVVKNRMHFDLASGSVSDQAAIVARARDLGAHPVDIGQREVPWQVLADPEGNEFCVLEPREQYRDAGAVAAMVADVADPVALAPFYAKACRWELLRSEPGSASLRAPSGRGPWLELLRVDEPKRVKNRMHLDVSPYPADDFAADVALLKELGARPIDVGQGAVPWAVLADPEGNEICVLTPR
jgi:predicted enzyme related to lactoylglutathione lyase